MDADNLFDTVLDAAFALAADPLTTRERTAKYNEILHAMRVLHDLAKKTENNQPAADPAVYV